MKEIASAKKEYTKQLMTIMTPIVYEETVKMYKHARASEEQKPVLVRFQSELRNVPEWSANRIGLEIEKMVNAAPHFEDILAAVFVTNVRILSAVKIGTTSKKFKLDLPSSETFVHDVYVRVAKALYANPLLFSDRRYSRLSDNRKEVFALIQENIEESIRHLLPVKAILESYLSREAEDDEEADEEKEPESRPASGAEAPVGAMPLPTYEDQQMAYEMAEQAVEVQEPVKQIPIPTGLANAYVHAQAVSGAPPESEPPFFKDARA